MGCRKIISRRGTYFEFCYTADIQVLKHLDAQELALPNLTNKQKQMILSRAYSEHQ
jgi:hypothetical protein